MPVGSWRGVEVFKFSAMHDAPTNGIFSMENELPAKGPVSLNRSLSQDVFEGPTVLHFEFPEAKASRDEAETTVIRQNLRHFFWSGKGGGLPIQGGLKPAILAPYFRSQFPGIDYPVWIPDNESLSQVVLPQSRCWTVDDLIRKSVSYFAPDAGDSELLKTHLSRIARIVRQKLEDSGDAAPAGLLWAEAFQELQKELQLKGVEGLQLTADLNKLRRALPPGGICVPFSSRAHFPLLSGLIEQYQQQRLGRIKTLTDGVLSRLREYSGEEKALAASALHTLEAAIQDISCKPCLLIGKSLHAQSGINPGQYFSFCSIRVMDEESIFGAAQLAFEEIGPFAGCLLEAVKNAKLVFEPQSSGVADSPIPLFLPGRPLSEEETVLCPQVIVLTDTASLADKGMSGFLACMRKGSPIKVCSTATGEIYGQTAIAAAAIAQQKAFVLQSVALDPNTLLEGLSAGLRFPGPAFFHLFGQRAPQGNGSVPNFVYNCAALESRVFPAIRYNPKNGRCWGARFEPVFNPQAAFPWPEHSLEVRQGKASQQAIPCIFTPVDFAALDPAYASGFKVVPPEDWTAELVPLELYPLSESVKESGTIPFIWMADDKFVLHKVAVSLPLIRLMQEHRDFWSYIQENTGIQNYHADRAVEAYKQEQLHTSKEETESGQTQTSVLEAYAAEAVQSAMEKLAAALLGFSTTGISGLISETAKESISEDIPTVTTPQTPKVPALGRVGVADEIPPASSEIGAVVATSAPLEVEAWIDTHLCTSCSECVDNFPGIFAYNEDKLAYVASPRGGSYADIVRAAERCPVGIIHPGTPWDASDPDLAELKERAKPFQ